MQAKEVLPIELGGTPFKGDIMKLKKIFSVLCVGVISVSAFAFAGCKDEPIQASEAVITGDNDAAIVVNAKTNSSSTKISDELFGIFLEDINYGVDGGLYAELVRNRSFEYGALAIDGALNGWRVDDNCNVEIIDGALDSSGICNNNENYARLSVSEGRAGILNIGFLSEGMAVFEGEKYNFSAYMKANDGYTGKIYVAIIDTQTREIFGEKEFSVSAEKNWIKYEGTIDCNVTANENVGFYFAIDKGSVDVDMISLIPQNNILNMRADLVNALKDLNPKFLRFPGGCVVEGSSLDTMYDWKDSIGVDRTDGKITSVTSTVVDIDNGEKTAVTSVGGVEARPIGIDIWDPAGSSGPAFSLQNGLSSENPYYMSYGIGFYEYLLLCEEMGILAVPDVSVGMTCFARSVTYEVATGEKLQQYVQDAIDFVAFCNGTVDSSDSNIAYWAQVRTDMGHPDPFNLKYLEIGNEQFGEDFVNNYSYFQKAFSEARASYPEVYASVEIIIPNGTDDTHTYAYDEIAASGLGSEYANIADEHYYIAPNDFYNNINMYDEAKYDGYLEQGISVFLGEYAARENTLRSAIAEAAYMTSLVRNGDVIRMASYAPLFARINLAETQWSAADMIWVTNSDYYLSPDYYIQQLYMQNCGKTLLASDIAVEGGTTITNIFHVATLDENGDIILIIVNTFGGMMTTGITIENASVESTAEVTIFNEKGIRDLNTKNSLEETKLYNTVSELTGVDTYFEFDSPAYSAAVIRIHTK